MIVYRSEDDGTLYLPNEVDIDEEGQAHGYIKFEVDDIVTLTAEQCCGHYGDIAEILIGAGKIRRA